MTDDSTREPEAAPPYDGEGGGSDVDASIPPILVFPEPTHEQWSKDIYNEVILLERQVRDLAARVATIDANVLEVKRLLVGLSNLIRTPSGISPGNAVERTLNLVTELHSEEFGPPTL